MINAAQVRLLAVIEVLAGNEYSGICLSDIAATVGEKHDSTVLHDLEAMEAAGWARRHDADRKRWVLAARPVQVLHNFYAGLKSVEAKKEEIAVNYTRLPI
jgi:DNA-binding IclR family transcriptional regulator